MLQPQVPSRLSISERDNQRNASNGVKQRHAIAAISQATMNISTKGYPETHDNGFPARPVELIDDGEDYTAKSKQRSKRKSKGVNIEAEDDSSKRRCVSTACIACR
jgi:hypothetical protein